VRIVDLYFPTPTLILLGLAAVSIAIGWHADSRGYDDTGTLFAAAGIVLTAVAFLVALP
jgi:hypothetical protein